MSELVTDSKHHDGLCNFTACVRVYVFVSASVFVCVWNLWSRAYCTISLSKAKSSLPFWLKQRPTRSHESCGIRNKAKSPFSFHHTKETRVWNLNCNHRKQTSVCNFNIYSLVTTCIPNEHDWTMSQNIGIKIIDRWSHDARRTSQ